MTAYRDEYETSINKELSDAYWICSKFTLIFGCAVSIRMRSSIRVRISFLYINYRIKVKYMDYARK